MSNNKQSSVEWFEKEINKLNFFLETRQITNTEFNQLKLKTLNKAKAMQQEQAHFYASFVLKCVENNLPPITFNDWINLENNEQPTTT